MQVKKKKRCIEKKCHLQPKNTYKTNKEANKCIWCEKEIIITIIHKKTKIILNLCSFVVLITLLFILGCSVHLGSSLHQCTTAAVDYIK